MARTCIISCDGDRPISSFILRSIPFKRRRQLSSSPMPRVPRMPGRIEAQLRGVMVAPPLTLAMHHRQRATPTNITFTGVKHLPLPSTAYQPALHNLNTVMYNTVSSRRCSLANTDSESGSSHEFATKRQRISAFLRTNLGSCRGFPERRRAHSRRIFFILWKFHSKSEESPSNWSFHSY